MDLAWAELLIQMRTSFKNILSMTCRDKYSNAYSMHRPDYMLPNIMNNALLKDIEGDANKFKTILKKRYLVCSVFSGLLVSNTYLHSTYLEIILYQAC